MTREIHLFEHVIEEFKKRWSFDIVEDMIGSTTKTPRWDHTLAQAFFANLGKSLGFKVACEKFRENWDVAWVKDDVHVRVEIEHGAKSKIQETFGRFSKTADRYYDKSQEAEAKQDFLGIFVIECNLEEQTKAYPDYFFDHILDPKDQSVEYPRRTTLDLLIVDIILNKYRWARVSPSREYQIFFTRGF